MPRVFANLSHLLFFGSTGEPVRASANHTSEAHAPLVNVAVVAAEPEIAERLCQALCQAGINPSVAPPRKPLTSEFDAVVLDGFPVESLARELALLLPGGGPRPWVFAGIEDAEAATLDAGLAAGADEFYVSGTERSLAFRATLWARRGARQSEAADAARRLEQANDAIYTVDFEGRFTAANAAAERLTGYTRAQLLGKSMAELLLPEYLEPTRAQIAAKLAGDLDFSFYEVQIRHAGGQPRWVEISSQLLLENGKPVAIQGIARDVSVRRQLDQRITFRAEMLDNMQAAAFAVDLDGVTLYWNAAAEAMFGIPAEEALGRRLIERIFEPEDARRGLEVLKEAGGPGTHSRLINLVRGDGSRFPGHVAASPLRDADGEPIGAVAVCLDLTERRAQQEQSQLLATIVESAAVAIIGRDTNHRVTSWNAAAERMFGYTAAEAIGSRMTRLGRPADLEVNLTHVGAITSGEPIDAETVRLHKDGHEIPVRMTSFPLHDADGHHTGSATLLYDLREQKASEQALRASEERYRAAAELSKDAFLILVAVRGELGNVTDFRIVDMNAAAGQLLTIPRDTALGGLLGELLPRVRDRGFMEAYARVAETGEVLDQEVELGSQFIRAKWIHQTVVKLGDGIAITIRDITERKHQQIQLDEARAQLKAIFESTSEAVLVVGPNLELIVANEAGLARALDSTGTAPSPGDDLRRWVEDSDVAAFERQCRRAFAGERVTTTGTSTATDGAVSWHEFTFNPVRNDRGEVYAVSIAARDITESLRLQQELAEREAALQAVFSSMNEALTLVDVERQFILGNPLSIERTRKFIGRTPETGHSMEEYVAPEHWRGFRHYHRRALNGERTTLELELADPDTGEKTWWEYSYDPVRDEEGEAVAVAMVIRDISDRKRAELALTQATAHHRAVIENTTDGLFALNVEEGEEGRNFRVAMVNSAFERMTGLSAERIAGRLIQDALPEASAKAAVARYEECIAAGHPITYEEIIPFGGRPHIQTTMSPVVDAEGRCHQIIGSSRDITERIRLEEEERASRERAERLAIIVESANDAILAVDLDGILTSWSPGAQRVYGYTAGEVIGKPASMLYVDEAEVVDSTLERLQRLFTGEGYSGVPTKRRHKDGHTIDLLVSAFPLRDSTGNIVGAGSTATDVTEQVRAEAAVREKAADLEAVFSGSYDRIVLLDTRGEIIKLNDAARAAWAGTHPGRALEGPYRDLVPPESRADFDETLARALAGESLNFERLIPGEPDTWLDVAYSPVRLEDGTVRGVVITSRDITERKRSAEALLQAQKSESLAVLAGGIAHDFNNLLVGILGNAGIALAELSPSSPARETIEAIELAGQRAAELARQMLAYSGKGRFLIQDVDLSSVVQEMTHLLRVSIGKAVDLRLHLASDLPSVQADATQLRQVVMNLVVNASDAIGEGSGVVSISTSVVDATSDLLAEAYLAPDLPPGRYVALEVQDTGCGMSPETLARIFDPFFTTKFTGRGLGLAATLGIMRGHRGAITVDSEPGKGTTFRLLFPANAAAAAQPAPSANPAAWRGSGTILVVDDEPTVRAVTARALKAFGFEVLEGADGLEGLNLFREHPEIGCVLLDMTMPRMNGEEAFAAIKRIRPDARIVLMSGYAEQDATERFGSRGLSGFIQKPYELATLREVIRAAMENNSAP